MIVKIFGQYHRSLEICGTIVDRYRANVNPSEHQLATLLQCNGRRWHRNGGRGKDTEIENIISFDVEVMYDGVY